MVFKDAHLCVLGAAGQKMACDELIDALFVGLQPCVSLYTIVHAEWSVASFVTTLLLIYKRRHTSYYI